MFEFKLPDLGEGIAEGEILKWHVSEGGTVAEDAPLVDVETDKAAVTIPAPRGGTVKALKGKVGDIVNVGDVVVVIDDGTGDQAAAAEAEADRVFAEPDRPEAATVPDAAVPAARPGVRRPVPAAPATRRLARELKVDINLVVPTGPGGRVTPEDVHRFAERGPAAAKAAPKAGRAHPRPRGPRRLGLRRVRGPRLGHHPLPGDRAAARLLGRRPGAHRGPALDPPQGGPQDGHLHGPDPPRGPHGRGRRHRPGRVPPPRARAAQGHDRRQPHPAGLRDEGGHGGPAHGARRSTPASIRSARRSSTRSTTTSASPRTRAAG